MMPPHTRAVERIRQRESPTEDDAGNLSLGARLPKHEQEPAYHDRDERK
jgi:hypothetical protein